MLARIMLQYIMQKIKNKITRNGSFPEETQDPGLPRK